MILYFGEEGKKVNTKLKFNLVGSFPSTQESRTLKIKLVYL